jgi:small-conductance mechanosensitive channel
MDLIRAAIAAATGWMEWLPDPVIALAIVAVSLLIANSLHRTARRLLNIALVDRYPYALTVLNEMRGVTRLALWIAALVLSVQVAPLAPNTADWLARLLLIAIVTLIGWGAITALRLAGQIYLRRFRIDTEDNLVARKHVTQVRVLIRTADVLVVIITIGAALMTFEPVRQYGVSLFASAGVAGLVAGLAARPVLSNLFAGIQLAMTQPIRIDDQVVIENEWGTIEEIRSTYVVVRIWDLRRLVVPLTYFIEKPFQNWTRESSAILGTAMLYVDYRAPVATIRARLRHILEQSDNWNGEVAGLQVTDARESTIELRCLMSANSAGQAFDLRCEVREKLVDFLQRHHPEALPTRRADIGFDDNALKAAGALTQRRERAGAH